MAELTVPSLDFSSLGNLGKVYQQAQADQLRRQTLASLGQGGAADADALLRSGDLSLAQLGINLRNREEDQNWRREEAARAQRNADRSYSLQERQFRENQDYTPEELDQRRRAQLRAAGVDPTSQAGQAFLLSGQYDPAAGQSKIPPGFERDQNGGLRPIAGGPADPAYLRQKGDRQNAPSGYIWNDPNDPSKGLTAIPGGPGEKVDAEVAGRLGLARSFLGQLPEIKRRVAEGGITGPIDAGQAYLGMGGPGEIRRQMDSGAEALLRMLTGAGMNKEEAAQYVRRYQFSPTDKAETVLSKLNQLERELNSVGETVGKGRGGWAPPGSAARPSGQGNGADAMLQHARDAIAQGAPRAAVIQRLQQAGIDPSGL